MPPVGDASAAGSSAGVSRERRPGSPPAALEARARDLARLTTERWDLLVVGGGIVGAGVLLDAASRGLRAALVERDDIAVGTSSRSSRLIHGGLRYLAQGQFGIVHESLAERARLLRLAPHLVRLEEFLFPLYGPPALVRAFYAAGMALYDVLGSARSGGPHRHVTKRTALDWAPALRPEGLRGAILYHDAMEDDARFALQVVRTAQALGALAVTRVTASGPIHEGGRVAGATLVDGVAGTALEARAAHVLDATGVWNALPDRPFGAAPFPVLPSRGSHLVIARERIPARGGLTLRIPGRTAFLVPWPRHWVIGTTDAPYRGPIDRPAASADEVDQILGTLNRMLALDLGRDDIVGTYAGLRPLVASQSTNSTVKVSREHRVSVDTDGIVRISGGKYTTYRVMARDAVDAALGPDAARRPSATADLPIRGAAPRAELDAMAGRLAAEPDLDEATARSLVDRHGTEAAAVLAFGRARDLVRPLAPGFPYLEAEAAWGVDQELALDLDDLLARRMRLAQEVRDRGAAVAPRVAAIVGPALGWDAARRTAEIDRYLERARREYSVPPSGAPGGGAGAGEGSASGTTQPAPPAAAG